ncbi:hypothetical protein TNCV_2046211 [Trichonephila clavipes]|uniref:Uncharacterized protein n=1 Tax=Trichonephila clavipes TaxID=2585209 RepID=A0A8X6VRM5_TRICX|nr:hypothetical protein TNCV_2046211 [Trichonephila clavipes]
MIASFVNDKHETWDQFLREFAYALRTWFMRPRGKPQQSYFFGRKLITPFDKLVMVKEGAEFVVDSIEKVNGLVLIEVHPIRCTTKKVVAKFKPKFEGPYRVSSVRNNNVVIWKAGRRTTVNIDQVRVYHQGESNEGVIDIDSSVSSGSEYQTNSLEENRPRFLRHGLRDWKKNKKKNANQRDQQESVTSPPPPPSKLRRKLSSSRRFKARSRRWVASVKPDLARKIKPISPPKQKRRHQENRPSGRSVQAQG